MNDAVAAGGCVPDAPCVPHVAFFAVRSPEVQSGDVRPACFEGRAKGGPDQSLRARDQYPVVSHPFSNGIARRPDISCRRGGG